MSGQSSQNKFSGSNRSVDKSRSVSELVGKVLEPVLARRTGMQLSMLQAWSELVGEEFAETTRPEKIKWPKRIQDDDPFEPAILVIACEPTAAIFLQHSQAEILERVNVFFGFDAIARIQIKQQAVVQAPSQPQSETTALPEATEQHLHDMLDDIEDPALRETLLKLGRGVLSNSR